MLKSKRADDGTKLYACWAGNADPDVNDPTIWHSAADWNSMLDEVRASMVAAPLDEVYAAMGRRPSPAGHTLEGFGAADIEGFYAELKAQAIERAPPVEAEQTSKHASLDDLAREVYGQKA